MSLPYCTELSLTTGAKTAGCQEDYTEQQKENSHWQHLWQCDDKATKSLSLLSGGTAMWNGIYFMKRFDYKDLYTKVHKNSAFSMDFIGLFHILK